MAIFKRQSKPNVTKIRKEELCDIQKDFSDISIDNISVLVRYNKGEYIVFIDCESDFDWETTDKFDDDNAKTKIERNKILNDIEWLQHQPCLQYIPEQRKNNFILLLAECWCYALDGCFEIAKAHLKRTEKYLNNRKIETSRKWQLSYCYIITIIITFITLIIKLLTIHFKLPISIIDWSTYIMFGAFGTTLSIVIKSGTRIYNCESGRLLNFLEILSKMFVSAISCAIIIILFNLDLIFTSLKDNHSIEMMWFLCIIAGFSERLIPSILQKFESSEIKEEKQ